MLPDKKRNYQVIVVGAGPAGSYAAATAASAGLEVLLLERDPVVGVPLACAEAISAASLHRFCPDVIPDAVSTSIKRIRMESAGGRVCEYRSETDIGFVLERPLFDSFLANRAATNGAVLCTAAYVHDLILVPGSPARLAVASEGGSIELTAEYVIAADGVESMIGRMAGLDTREIIGRADAALQYRVEGIQLDPHCLQFYVGSTYTAHGYLWVFPKSEHAANIGLGVSLLGDSAPELRSRLDRFVRERFQEGRVTAEMCGMIPKFVGFDTLGRENLLLAGDAARTLDSLTGAGIAKAMHTGKLAAETVVLAIAQGLTRGEIQREYRNRVTGEMGDDLRFFRTAEQVFRKFSDRDWGSLIDALNEYFKNEMTGSLDPVAFVKTVFRKSPALWRLARHLV